MNTLAALKSIGAAWPDGAPIYVIMDNLSAHKGADIRRGAKKHKVELCFTWSPNARNAPASQREGIRWGGRPALAA